MSNIILNSDVSSSAKLYRNVRIVNSNISNLCCVGDDSDVVDCTLEEKSELGRRNIIRNIYMGKGSYTGTNTIIKNAEIGKYCSISWNVSIGGLNHPYQNISMYTDYWFKKTFDVDINKKGKEDTSTKVVIGNDVWIGAGAIILNGVNIGSGCVIGAGSIVTKSIEPYSVVVGNPANQIKKRFSDQVIELLMKLQWWNWSEDKIRENIDLLRNVPDIDLLNEILMSENSNGE